MSNIFLKELVEAFIVVNSHSASHEIFILNSVFNTLSDDDHDLKWYFAVKIGEYYSRRSDFKGALRYYKIGYTWCMDVYTRGLIFINYLICKKRLKRPLNRNILTALNELRSIKVSDPSNERSPRFDFEEEVIKQLVTGDLHPIKITTTLLSKECQIYSVAFFIFTFEPKTNVETFVHNRLKLSIRHLRGTQMMGYRTIVKRFGKDELPTIQLFVDTMVKLGFSNPRIRRKMLKYSKDRGRFYRKYIK